MLKIALIIPNLAKGYKLNSVPLGLSYIGSVLKNAGYEVKGFNLCYDKFHDSTAKEYDIFGLSATSSMIGRAAHLAKFIKEHNPESFIVLGGAHATAVKEKVLEEYDCFDALIFGEGEIPFLELAKKLDNKEELYEVPNLIYKKGGKIVKSEKIFFQKDLDELPFPDKDIFDVSNYPDKIQAYGDVIASRGCPFRCTNCKPGLDNISKYRLRDYRKVVDELEFLMKKYGVRHFSFSDSELAGPKNWILDFCQEIKKRKLKITYSANGRTNQVDEEVVKNLRDSGCVFIGYGVESGSQDVVDNILKKGINLEQTREVIKMTAKNGLGSGTWFMVGIPGETWENVLETIEFAKNLNALTIEVNIATPWPDTGFYLVSKENGWLENEDWTAYNEKNATVINTPYLPLSPENKVLEAFELFKSEMKKAGWKMEENSNRFFHPNFVSRAVKNNLFQIMRRGISVSDFKKLTRFLGIVSQ